MSPFSVSTFVNPVHFIVAEVLGKSRAGPVSRSQDLTGVELKPKSLAFQDNCIVRGGIQ